MITIEGMGDGTTKGYALGFAYNTRMKTVWLMCIFFMIVIDVKFGGEK
jgi:hypothetical protein